jgi:acetate kinase
VAQMSTSSSVLVLNSGSSSVKFALLRPGSGKRLMGGIGERLGTPEALLRVQWFPAEAFEERLPESTHRAVIGRVLNHLAEAGDEGVHLLGAGHRVVHGGERFASSVLVDDAVISTVRSFSHLAPLHNPANLAGIEAVRAVLPELPQVAVFDTAFHQTMPPHAFRYAVPEEWYTRHGVRRYGFHGISHRFVSEQAASMLGRAPGELRLVTAHLGNGCSATAVRDGVSVDTTMGRDDTRAYKMGRGIKAGRVWTPHRRYRRPAR